MSSPQVVVQIEKGSTGQLTTVPCTRIWVENSANLALHDHSMDPNRGRLSPVPFSDTNADAVRLTPTEPSVLAGIYGGRFFR